MAIALTKVPAHLVSLESLTDAGWVLTLIYTADFEGHYAQVGAIVHKSLVVGAHVMTGQQQGLFTRVMARIISLESPQS